VKLVSQAAVSPRASDQRYTPQDVLDVVRAFDVIGLDPCANDENTVGAASFFTAAHDGLSRPWTGYGLVYANSPYSRGLLLPWTRKAIHEAREGAEVIDLVPADMSTNWTRHLLNSANAVAFWNKRIPFLLPDGAYDNGAKFGNAAYYFGERQGRFRRVFSPHAHVLTLR
jgi:phage N-6-adenine-methyltransferase